MERKSVSVGSVCVLGKPWLELLADCVLLLLLVVVMVMVVVLTPKLEHLH